MSRRLKWLVGALVLVTAACLIAVAFMAAGRSESGEEGEEEEAVKAPARVSVVNGRTVITLDAETQAREGMVAAAAEPASKQEELRGTAVILSVSDLAALRNNYVAARARVERTEAEAGVSRSEYERVKTLYEQDQNMSLKAMQEADAAYRNDVARLKADRQDARLQLDSTRQRWGSAAADWIERDSSELEAVLEQREYAVQVIFPPGTLGDPPATLSLQAPGNVLVPARLVSPMPQVDPQVQGISFLYLLPRNAGMAVGMNLPVLIPVGGPVEGAIVPGNSVVWWQGKAWVYEQTSPTTFSRREVPSGNPVTGGYFVPGKEFLSTKLVVAGAQALLSEEFRNLIQIED